MNDIQTKTKFKAEQNEIKISALKKSNSELNAKILGSEASINNLKSRATATETAIAVHEGRIDDVEDDLAGIESRLTTAEGEIDVLQTSGGGGSGAGASCGCSCDRTYNTYECLRYDCSSSKNALGRTPAIHFFLDKNCLTKINLNFDMMYGNVSVKTVEVKLNDEIIFTHTESLGNTTQSHSVSHIFLPSKNMNKIEIIGTSVSSFNSTNYYISVRNVILEVFGRNIEFFVKNNDFSAFPGWLNTAVGYLGQDGGYYTLLCPLGSTFDFNAAATKLMHYSQDNLTNSYYAYMLNAYRTSGGGSSQDSLLVQGYIIDEDNTCQLAIAENKITMTSAKPYLTLVNNDSMGIEVVDFAACHRTASEVFTLFPAVCLRYDKTICLRIERYNNFLEVNIPAGDYIGVGGTANMCHTLDYAYLGLVTRSDGTNVLFYINGNDTTQQQFVEVGFGSNPHCTISATQIRVFLRSYNRVFEKILERNVSSGEWEIVEEIVHDHTQGFWRNADGSFVKRVGQHAYYYLSDTATEPTSTFDIN